MDAEKKSDAQTEEKMQEKHGKTKANSERKKKKDKDAVLSQDVDENLKVDRIVDESSRLKDRKEGNKSAKNSLTKVLAAGDGKGSEQMDGAARNKLYERAVEYKGKGKRDLALKCFLECITGLSNNEGFAYLPQCLKQIADIYYDKEEYEKAIEFIQAEKMYYETALINTTGIKEHIDTNMKESTTEDIQEEVEDLGANDAVRAEEYEKLARLCLEKEQAELALEYQGKATKIRQEFFGTDHETTKKSLDFFTVVYAEVGKQQYTESMQKFSEKAPEDCQNIELVSSEPPGHVRRPSSGILRKRTASGETEEHKPKDRHVHFQEPEEDDIHIRQREESISRGLLWVLFGLCLLVLSVLLVYIYCRLETGSSTCATWRSELYYFYMRAKYLYYTWNPEPGNKFG